MYKIYFNAHSCVRELRIRDMLDKKVSTNMNIHIHMNITIFIPALFEEKAGIM